MENVFLLWHINESDEGEKLIGVYRTESDARFAIERVRPKPGFSACPDGFQISSYELNRDHWTEGFVMTSVSNDPRS